MNDFAILYEADLLTPQEGVREFTLQAGWKNTVHVLLDDEELDTGERRSYTQRHLAKPSYKIKILWTQDDLRRPMSIFLNGDEERNGLSRAAVDHLNETVYIVKATDEPYIVRKTIHLIPADSIAVGFPGGLNYAYHAPTGAIVGAWERRWPKHWPQHRTTRPGRQPSNRQLALQ